MKLGKIILAAALLASMGNMAALAGQWIQTGGRWWYRNEDGSFPTASWQWIDGNGDGKEECYYFDADGWLATDAVTPDGHTVDGSGRWVADGEVQVRDAGGVAQDIKYGTPTATGAGTAQYQGYASMVDGEYGYDRSIIDGSEVWSSIFSKYKLTCVSDNEILVECTGYNRFTGEEVTWPPCIATRQTDGSYRMPEESQANYGDSFKINTSTKEMIFENDGSFYIFSKMQ